ncbi:hypothetical protein, partial [Klebsiella pneumoniae]|uniref:hypothetical protein n=1 Tax=Klebsiella pneumoniae TaxID=573 RepID=UPI00358FC918
GKSLPDGCDAVFAVLQAQSGLSDALRWERIDAAADAQQPAVMRSAARGLPAADLALAQASTDALTTPERLHKLAAWFDAANRTRDLLRTTVRADLA